ncbi:hypothetical protein RRG08_050528 [Elysia crispata]|uniref:Secreted protein n=1 Tax=Elysia crispata TaxID=231223 RepID=A0AAE1DN95_9GAST|nr:hypothetical protein RRG08_050528 [Elysia crispata]
MMVGCKAGVTLTLALLWTITSFDDARVSTKRCSPRQLETDPAEFSQLPSLCGTSKTARALGSTKNAAKSITELGSA